MSLSLFLGFFSEIACYDELYNVLYMNLDVRLIAPSAIHIIYTVNMNI